MHQPVVPIEIDYLSIRGQIMALGEIVAELASSGEFQDSNAVIFDTVRLMLVDIVKPYKSLLVTQKDQFEKLLYWIELYLNEAIGIELECLIVWRDNGMEVTSASQEEIWDRIVYVRQFFANTRAGDLMGKKDN